MDPDTERELAAMIMEEASRLRAQAERDGVAAYLAKPAVRGRPNPQFLQATVRSVQQSNRIVEVNEMWRRRSVELEYERKRSRRHDGGRNDSHSQRGSSSHDHPEIEDIREDGLGDEELEEFLRSRVKRGRGAVGSRMDETGPYLPLPRETLSERTSMADVRVNEEWEERIAGPEAGPSMPDNQERDWKGKKLKSKRKSPSANEGEDEEPQSKRRRHKREKKERKEGRDGESRKKRKKLEKSSRRRR